MTIINGYIETQSGLVFNWHTSMFTWYGIYIHTGHTTPTQNSIYIIEYYMTIFSTTCTTTQATWSTQNPTKQNMELSISPRRRCILYLIIQQLSSAQRMKKTYMKQLFAWMQ